MNPRTILTGALAVVLCSPAAAQTGTVDGQRYERAGDPAEAATAGPPAEAATLAQMSGFDVLTGTTWVAAGDGFSTELRYEWLLPGRMLRATNEVRSDDGSVLARYDGAYAWDAGREEVVFWTVAESGEVHRGRAWWRDGVLWHEAAVSGGAIDGYASAMRPGAGRIEYFASYGADRASAALLDGDPLVYRPASAVPAAASDAGPLGALAFMVGCWRGEFDGGSALEETYTAASGGVMLGTSRYLRGGRAVQFEFSRIGVDSAGVVSLLPYPGGRASAHAFRLSDGDGSSALFEAPEHDFPKRIRYALGGDGALTARIDGGAGDDRVQEWRMLPVACPAAGSAR